MLAQRVIDFSTLDKRFKMWQKTLKKNLNAKKDDEWFANEFDSLLDIDPYVLTHFHNKIPTVEEWKAKREFYSHEAGIPEIDMSLFEAELPKYFNNLEIQLFVRDPKKFTKE